MASNVPVVEASAWRKGYRGLAAAVLVFADAQPDRHSDHYRRRWRHRDCEHGACKHIDPSNFRSRRSRVHVELTGGTPRDQFRTRCPGRRARTAHASPDAIAVTLLPRSVGYRLSPRSTVPDARVSNFDDLEYSAGAIEGSDDGSFDRVSVRTLAARPRRARAPARSCHEHVARAASAEALQVQVSGRPSVPGRVTRHRPRTDDGSRRDPRPPPRTALRRCGASRTVSAVDDLVPRTVSPNPLETPHE